MRACRIPARPFSLPCCERRTPYESIRRGSCIEHRPARQSAADAASAAKIVAVMVGLPVILRRVLNRLVNSVANRAPLWCARGAAVWLLALCLAGGACADTIVLKNGRRIIGESVTQQNGKVTCETAAGLVTIPESMVAR